ncbi:DUF885 domain-containing protein [Lysobacter sp. Root494]|uniref:DUF885 domain-containing protein n=1 Tax=Lysobacter sp. Root494 TaxID=1736549 RepID=UPI0006FD7CE2|nr:DUF885 domain-containing protein [Lysobacter sp. Root494]KQY52528.1 hypothetical protein ASD14_08005 [Lysobacter sp. Root494]
MFRTLAAAAVLLVAFVAPVRAQSNDAAKALHRLFDEEWERGLRENPVNASYQGDKRYNDRWSDASLAAIEASQSADRKALERIRAIDRNALSPADQLNYDTFLWLQEKAVERQKFRTYLQPISHQGGVQTLDGIAEILPFASTQDYRDWLKRMDAIPVMVEQTIALMREGVMAGSLPPKVLMQRVPRQVAAQIVEDPTQSPFYSAFQKFRDGVPQSDRAGLQAEAQRIIRDRIVPAYQALQTYFNNEYLPKTRESIAAADLPNGKAYYDYLAGYYTTTDLTADEIHAIGLKEVVRIRAQMEKIRQEVGFKGSMADFFTFLRTDPRFFEKTPQALLTHYRDVAKRIDPELVKAFKTIPRQPYGVRPIPDTVAPDTTTAYYQPGAADGSRAGFYYVNLYRPETRPTWEMVPLSLHESVPGHHFQFARSLELPDAPMFRRTAYFVAYSEGWGLYAEQLGFDMDLYGDPYDRMGQLAYEMWRAVRLVVDTGMHARGWSREKAIAFFKENSPKTDQDIVNEIDRYIGDPGQALAYKIGQLKISELRARAKERLGDRFDVREFNDEVLATGSVPLQALERHIDAWIAGRKG